MRKHTRIKGFSLVTLFLLIGSALLGSLTALADDEPRRPPIPGNMIGDEPIIDVGYKTPISPSPPQTTEITRTVDIVNLITQIDEPMILGYLQNLTSYGPRVTGETGCVQAAEYLYNELASMGLWVRYRPWSYNGYSSNNVEAILNGTDPSSDDIYIVCGHYDTVAGSPGADDDGSGVVAVLAAAKVMSQGQFNHTVRFVAFSGEEEGLYGSYMYVEEAYNSGDDIKGVLNADMIGFALDHIQAGSINIYEDDFSEWLYGYTYTVNQIYDDYIGLDLIPAGWSWGSDHYYFWEYGYAALFYHEYEFNHYYHSPDDTIQHMNLTYDVKGTRLIIATLASLAQIDFLNSPPLTPTIQGPHYGKVGVEYTFTIGPITDPDMDDFYLILEWGDGTQSDWLGPFTSGQVFTQAHSWSAPGVYHVRAKAKDTYGATSAWSEPFTIYITSKVFLIGLISDVLPNNEATHCTLKRGILLEFSPLSLQRYSSVGVVVLNNETKGYLGSRFMIGQFYAVIVVEPWTAVHPLRERFKS